MRIVLQRVKEASVTIEDRQQAEIKQGLLLLVGIEDADTIEIIEKMAKKCMELRIFEDEQQKMNLSVQDIAGEVLSVSQFTLYADCKKGRRPSFTQAAQPAFASKMYDHFNEHLKTYGRAVQTGVFGADMKVKLWNDGPVTIILDSRELLG